MDSKNILTTVVVAAIVTIVVFFAMDTLQLSPILGKAMPIGSYSSTEFVNANECTKDGVCEVDNVVGQVGDFDSLEANDLDVNGATHIKGDLILNPDALDCRTYPYSNGTGDSTCQSFGYDFCWMAEREMVETYYDSVGNCNNETLGDVQVRHKWRYLANCPTLGGSSGRGCGTQSGGVEPYYGDITSGESGLIRLICCK